MPDRYLGPESLKYRTLWNTHFTRKIGSSPTSKSSFKQRGAYFKHMWQNTVKVWRGLLKNKKKTSGLIFYPKNKCQIFIFANRHPWISIATKSPPILLCMRHRVSEHSKRVSARPLVWSFKRVENENCTLMNTSKKTTRVNVTESSYSFPRNKYTTLLVIWGYYIFRYIYVKLLHLPWEST